MIAANYTTHAYCDGPNHDDFDKPEAEFIGESWAETKRMAKQDGWTFSVDRERAYCPDCTKNKAWRLK